MNCKAYLTLLLAATLAGTQCRCAGSAGDPNPAASTVSDPVLVVKAVQAKAENWTISIPVSGSLRSKSMVEIKAEVGGRLMDMRFEEGDQVQRDQLLAEIDPSNYKLAADQANAALAVAEAGLARAKVMLEHSVREKDRADNLLRSGGITEKDHQAATTAVKDAEAQVRLSEAQCNQAKAAVALTEKALKDCRVVAPTAGRVQRKYFDKGTLIIPGASLYSLVDNSRLELECHLQASRLSEVRLGQRVVFTTPTFGDRRFEGLVSAVNPIVESDSRSVKVDVSVPNPGGELLSGMYARGVVDVRTQTGAAVIPRSALMVDSEESSGSVYVIENGKARKRNIRVGGTQQDRIWVQEGLQEGEWVIIEIGPNLKDGTSVKTGPIA